MTGIVPGAYQAAAAFVPYAAGGSVLGMLVIFLVVASVCLVVKKRNQRKENDTDSEENPMETHINIGEC